MPEIDVLFNPVQSNESAEVVTYPELSKVLSTATFARNRAIADNVEGLQLGIFKADADNLIKLSLQHPKGHEFGRPYYVSPYGNLFGDDKIFHGDGRVDFDPQIEYTKRASYFGTSRRDRQNKFIATTLHTHGTDDTNLSPGDFVTLLLENIDLYASTAAFVATPTRRVIVFRGQSTPMLSAAEAEEQMWLYMDVGRQVSRRVSETEENLIKNKEYFVSTMLNIFAITRDFRVYACTADETIAKRIHYSSLPEL